MSDEKLQFEKAKQFHKLNKEVEELKLLEKEVNELQNIDQQIRKHGKNQKINKVIEQLEKLRTLIVGKGCEFYELGWCEILNKECEVTDKINCKIRKEQLQKQGKYIEGIVTGRQPRKTKLKKKLYEFQQLP